ncbi:MAG: hypothetical protein ACK4FM_03260 [Caldimicrobium sp.]
MKYLLLMLAIFVIFWYYKKSRSKKKITKRALEMEMRACKNCGVYFSLPEDKSPGELENRDLQFCSEKCYREYLEKSGER